MRIRLINFPRYVPIERYEAAIEKVCNILTQQKGILSIYQIGTIGNPGISDIDLVAVFRDEVKCDVDPLSCLDKEERYPFTHSVFGLCEKHFIEIQKYSIYEYKHLWGKQLVLWMIHSEQRDLTILKKQIAIEFLIANYIARTREKEYKIISIRNLLLSTKAVMYDLDFLSIKHGNLFNLVNDIIKWRKEWFHVKIKVEEITDWFLFYYNALVQNLNHELKRNFFYLPANRIQYGKNCTIVRKEKLGYKRTGFIMPLFAAKLGKKYFRLNNRFNLFSFEIPYSIESKSDLLINRFYFFEKVNRYNISHLKNFILPGGSFSNKDLFE